MTISPPPTVTIPEHITPRAMYDMPSAEFDALLEAIRERRLHAVRVHEQAMALAKEQADAKAKEALWKQCEMLANNMERVQKALDAMDERVNKIRALRLELGID